jgi:hypothetical protein
VTPTPPMYCKVCQLPLNTAGDVDEQGFMFHIRYEHPEYYQADHEPDPHVITSYGELLAHCDFCLAVVTDGGWTYPCKDFYVMVGIGGGKATKYGCAGDWCACDDCHQDVETDNWDAMIQRSVTWQQAVDKDHCEKFMRNMWVGFENHRTGPAYHETRKGGR